MNLIHVGVLRQAIVSMRDTLSRCPECPRRAEAIRKGEAVCSALDKVIELAHKINALQKVAEDLKAETVGAMGEFRDVMLDLVPPESRDRFRQAFDLDLDG